MGGRQIKGDGARPWPPLALDSILLVTVCTLSILGQNFVRGSPHFQGAPDQWFGRTLNMEFLKTEGKSIESIESI